MLHGHGRLWCGTTKNVVVAVVVVFFLISFPKGTTAYRISGTEHNQMLVVTTPLSTGQYGTPLHNSTTPIPPEIYSFRVQSDIKYRYSRTLITSRVANKDLYRAQQVTFSVVLPDTAFISKFVMEIDGTAYEAYVKEKEQATRDYAQARRQGQSAGLVEKSTRNSNIFDVNVNVKSKSKVTFSLTYEELLIRKRGRYEQSININPDQVASIPDYQIVVNVEESRNLTFVRVPSLSNDVDAQDDQGNNPDAVIQRPKNNKAIITWSPTTAAQRKLVKEETSGNFLVQYDVDRETDAGQILLMQGYFVHFFSPVSLPPLRKHIVFILDISGSMQGRRLEQLKESQNKILEDLSPDDFFNIITFSSGVSQWSPDWRSKQQPFPATPQNVFAAKTFISSLRAEGGTDIHGAITEALSLTAAIKDAQRNASPQPPPSPTSEENYDSFEWGLVRATVETQTAREELQVLPLNVQSLIIFLTDGEPTVGVTNHAEIQNKIRSANEKLSIPIYSLGFGEGADFPFLKKLSLQNNGFGRKIYEASDATLQLEGFYSEISSPLLSNVTFKYTSEDYNVSEITVTRFPTVFGGGEIAVAGKLGQTGRSSVIGCGFEPFENINLDVNVGGVGREGEVTLDQVEFFRMPCVVDINLFLPRHHSNHPPRSTPPPTPEDKFLERLWAYLTISQLIEKDSSGVDDPHSEDGNPLTANFPRPETSKQRALRLALRYGFVTPLTSLVVVKPNSSDVTNTVSTDALPDALDSSSATSQPYYPSLAYAPRAPPIPVSFSIPFNVPPSHTVGRSGGIPHHSNSWQYSSVPIPMPQPQPQPTSQSIFDDYSGLSREEVDEDLQGMVLEGQSFGYPSHSAENRPSTSQTYSGFTRHSGNTHVSHSSHSPGPSRAMDDYESNSEESINWLEGAADDDEPTGGEAEMNWIPAGTIPPPVPSTTTSSPRLTLDQITWLYHRSTAIIVNRRLYRISRNLPTAGDNEGYTCFGSTTGTQGHCQHLQNCVLPAFLNDRNTYTDSYFCEITSTSGYGSTLYAGVCCPSSNHPIRVTTRRIFYSLFSHNFNR